MIHRQGWYVIRKIDRYRRVNHNNRQYREYDVVYSTSRISSHNVNIHVSSLGDRYVVSTSGAILYEKEPEKFFISLRDDESYVRKLMKYVDYGRKTLKITDIGDY